MSEIKQTPDGYHICPGCGHHTSAFAGRCTLIDPQTLAYCGCDCYKAIHGESLHDKIARSLWEKRKENDNER